jgi:hypothetical protein
MDMGRDYNRHFRMNQLNEFRRAALCRRTKCKRDDTIDAVVAQLRQHVDSLGGDALEEVLERLAGD